MATSTAKTTSTELPDFAQKFREQLVSSVQQGQQLSLDAAHNWVKAISVLPIPEFPAIPGVPAVPGVEAATKFGFDVATDLLNAQQRCTRLAGRVQQLEKRLSEQLGEQAWHQSGLGAPEDIDQLKQRIVFLEQQSTDLRLQLDERDQDLAAARVTNRELMTRLNAPQHAR